MRKSERQPGERAEVIIGKNWHKVRVLSVVEVPHFSGESSEMFTVQFIDNEKVIHCGRNSIRRTK